MAPGVACCRPAEIDCVRPLLQRYPWPYLETGVGKGGVAEITVREADAGAGAAGTADR